MPSTRDRVQALRRYGFSYAEIADVLDISKPTVAYHCRRLGEEADPRFTRRYDWAEIQRYYDEGHSITDCQERFGFARATWASARRRGEVVSRPQAMPLEQLLGGPRQRGHVKQRLIALGLKEDRCETCGVDQWCGRPLSMALHHVNGQHDDNRLENLQLLCPNCHSQTENFAGRNHRPRGSRPG